MNLCLFVCLCTAAPVEYKKIQHQKILPFAINRIFFLQQIAYVCHFTSLQYTNCVVH